MEESCKSSKILGKISKNFQKFPKISKILEKKIQKFPKILPFQICVAVVGVNEQRRSHLRVAQRHDAVDVAVVHCVKVEPFLQHHGDLQSRRLIRHGFDVNLALLAVCVNVHGVQEPAESYLLSNSPQLDLGPGKKRRKKDEKISISRSPAEGRFRSPLSATEIHASRLTNSLI